MKTPKKEHNVLLLSIVIVIAIVMLFLTFSKIDKSRYVTKLDLVGGATSTSGEHNTFSGSPTTYKQLGVSSYYMQLVQSFVLPSTSTLKSVKLGLARQGNPNYPITVSIRKGSPIGNDIFTPVTIPLQSLQQISTDYRNPSWIEVAMPSFTLNGGTTYYLALKVTQSDSGDYYRWSATSNTYSSGVLYRITSSGSFYDYPSNDALATILYTTTSPPPPPPPTTCSDGTAKNQCSSTKPLYCNSALQLVNNCGSCGCSAGYTCQSDGACIITPITQTSGIQTINNILPNTDGDFSILGGDNIVVSPSVNGIKIDANTLSASSIQINVRDFGAVPDDDIDDTSAIQAALNRLRQGTEVYQNFYVFLPAGTYRISSTLESPNSASNWILVGEGKYTSLLKWFGPAGRPVLKLVNARDVTLKDFGIFGGNFGNPPSYGIQVHRGAGLIGSAAPSSVKFSNIFIGNYYGEAITDGIAYTAEAGYDANNELGLFVDVEIANVNRYGISFEHSNSLLHTIIGGQIIGKVAAINNVGPDGEQGGSFSLYGTILGTSANGHLFRLGKSSHTITIVGGNAESEGGLLTTPITIINDSPLVSIIGGSYLFGDPPAGGYTVLWDATGGKLVISGVNLATPNGAKWRFPSAGFSEVIIRDSDLTTNSIEYNNKVVIEGVREHAGIHHFNNENIVNLGEGALVIKESSGGFTGPRFFDNTDTTPSVQGWDYFEANFPNPITITNFDDGFVGKEFVLYSHTDNSVIKHDANGPGVGPIRLSTGKDYKMPARSIMRFRMIGIPFGSIWVNEP